MAPNRCRSLSNPHWHTHPMHACKPPAVQWVAPPAKNQPKAVLSTPEGLVLARWLRGWNYVQDYRKSIFKYTRASCQSSLSTFCKPCHPRFFSLLCASTGQAPPEQQSASALVVHGFILCSSCAHPATVDPRWSKESCWSSCPGAHGVRTTLRSHAVNVATEAKIWFWTSGGNIERSRSWVRLDAICEWL